MATAIERIIYDVEHGHGAGPDDDRDFKGMASIATHLEVRLKHHAKTSQRAKSDKSWFDSVPSQRALVK